MQEAIAKHMLDMLLCCLSSGPPRAPMCPAAAVTCAHMPGVLVVLPWLLMEA